MSARVLLLVALLIGCATAVSAAQCRAVVIAGDPGDEEAWAKNFARWGDEWCKLLVERGAAAGDVRLLVTPPKAEREKAAADKLATRANVIAALEGLARTCAPEDQAVVVLIGHAYQSEGVGKLCLASTDLTDADAAKALSGLRAKRAVILYLAPEAAPWAKSLAKPGRVIVCANVKQSAPYYGEFLLRALRANAGGGLLDAFNKASLATIVWYQNQFQQKGDKQPTVHGRENQDVYRTVYGPDFVVGDDQPHEAVNDIHRNPDFRGRRVLVEVAGLEDDGDGKPSTVYDEGLDPKPVAGTGDGKLAKDLVLGKP